MSEKKRPAPIREPAFFCCGRRRLRRDSVNRACIYASAAVDAGICVDLALLTGFADCVYRAGIITCAAIDALFGNLVGHFYSPPFSVFATRPWNLAQGSCNVQHLLPGHVPPGKKIYLSRESWWCNIKNGFIFAYFGYRIFY
jgi:hypothetical protein